MKIIIILTLSFAVKKMNRQVNNKNKNADAAVLGICSLVVTRFDVPQKKVINNRTRRMIIAIIPCNGWL